MEAFSTKSKKPQPALSPKSRQNPKIHAPNWLQYFLTALDWLPKFTKMISEIPWQKLAFAGVILISQLKIGGGVYCFAGYNAQYEAWRKNGNLGVDRSVVGRFRHCADVVWRD